MVTNLF